MKEKDRLQYVVKMLGSKNPQLSFLCKGTRDDCRKVIAMIDKSMQYTKNVFLSHEEADFIECVYEEAMPSIENESGLNCVRYIIDAADLYPSAWIKEENVISCSSWMEDYDGLASEDKWLLENVKQPSAETSSAESKPGAFVPKQLCFEARTFCECADRYGACTSATAMCKYRQEKQKNGYQRIGTGKSE